MTVLVGARGGDLWIAVFVCTGRYSPSLWRNSVSGALRPFSGGLDFSGRMIGGDSRGALHCPAFRGPRPRQELVEAVVRPEIDEAGENIGEVGLRVDTLELARFNQRGNASPIFGPVVRGHHIMLGFWDLRFGSPIRSIPMSGEPS